MATLLQRTAVGWCVLMILFLTAVQLFGDERPPWGLFLLFVGVWVFGAVMLLQRPVFGAIGTALYGVLLGAQLLREHGVSTLNVTLAVASFLAAANALAFLAAHRRGSG